MNKVTSLLDLQTIKNYIKNTDYINSNNIEIPCLSQSKSYLKIIGISYLIESSVQDSLSYIPWTYGPC